MSVQVAEDVRGWLWQVEAFLLVQHTAGKRVLEIGTWCGRSAITMALAGAKVDCVDTFQGDWSTGPEDVYEEFQRNVERYGVGDRIGVFRGDFREVLPKLDLSVYDCVYLDADHKYQPTWDLADLLQDRVRPDCTWIVHDIDQPEVLSVFHQLMANMVRTMTAAGRLGVLH